MKSSAIKILLLLIITTGLTTKNAVCQTRLDLNELLNFCNGDNESIYENYIANKGYRLLSDGLYASKSAYLKIHITQDRKLHFLMYACPLSFAQDFKKEIDEQSFFQYIDKNGYKNYVTLNGRYAVGFFEKTKEGQMNISCSLLSKDKEVKAYPVKPGKFYITAYMNTTSISVKPGDKIYFRASNKVKLGLFAGHSTPDGIDGFTAFNYIPGFRHGALLGKIGNGDWFFIGSEKTITATTGGVLKLTVNDGHPDDDDGSFDVDYSINRPLPN